MHKKEQNQEKQEVENKAEKQEGKDTNKHEKEAKIEELTNDLKRLQAEFENYRKRSEKENSEYREYSSASIIEQVLPVLDSLEQGIKHNPDFTQVYEQLYSILKKNGLEKIGVNVGDDFNHDVMDCLMQECDEKLEEGKITKVLSTGYKLKGKILRTTKISINNLSQKEGIKKSEEIKNNEKVDCNQKAKNESEKGRID